MFGFSISNKLTGTPKRTYITPAYPPAERTSVNRMIFNIISNLNTPSFLPHSLKSSPILGNLPMQSLPTYVPSVGLRQTGI